MTLIQLFTNIANAIRAKRNTTNQIKATNFASEILSISTSTGGGEEDYIQTNYYDLLLNGNYGYFSPEMCEKLMNGTYVL